MFKNNIYIIYFNIYLFINCIFRYLSMNTSLHYFSFIKTFWFWRSFNGDICWRGRMEDFFFLIPVLFKFPVGLWSQFILQIWNESYKVIGKVFALHFLTSHVLVFGVFSPRRPVTWCPRGTMRRTWSWTRRSRPCVGKMKHWWRGTRWVSVIVVAAESVLHRKLLLHFSLTVLCDYFTSRKWRRTRKGQRRREWLCWAVRAKPTTWPSQSASPPLWVCAEWIQVTENTSEMFHFRPVLLK